jgi:hypothetical protein
LGNWNITIRGVGVHHNGSNADGSPKLPADANVMTADFVRALKAAGHSVIAASFTNGAEDDLTHVEPTKPQG